MNFNDINKIYSHMRMKIYPNVKTVWKNVSTEEVLIDRYLSVVDDNRKYKLLCVPYLVDTESFLKRYKDRCIIFYNTPDPSDGLMLFIHQINPQLHIHSRFFCWVENGETYDYIASLVFHKDSQEALSFIDSNFDIRCEGNTEESSRVGFNFNQSKL